MEVTGATDVGVRNRRPVRGRWGPFGFEIVLQDRVDGGEGARADLQRPAAGCLQPVAAIALDQPDNADRGPESLLRVRALAHDGLDQRRGIPDYCGPFVPRCGSQVEPHVRESISAPRACGAAS